MAPLATNSTGASGFRPLSSSTSLVIWAGVARSNFVIIRRSATAHCRATIGNSARFRAPLIPSIVATNPSKRRTPRRRRSPINCRSVGAGSARPEVSMMMRRGGIARRVSAHTVAQRSLPAEQQRHPFASNSTSSGLMACAKIASSTPTAPNSFTMTATLSTSGCLSNAAINVVFPLPRKPVPIERGMRSGITNSPVPHLCGTGERR